MNDSGSYNDIDCRNCEYYINTNYEHSTSPAWCSCPPKGWIEHPQLAPMCRKFKPRIPKDKYGRPLKQTDDLHAAIDALNTFTKAWCMDCKATSEGDEPVFRCAECHFKIDNVCKIKTFCYDHDDTYTKSVDFGCMGVL